jgi:hypothetical protein
VIAVDDGSNETAYGVSGVLASQILEDKVTSAPEAAQGFTAALAKATAPAAAPRPASPAPAATTSAPAAQLPPPSAAGEAQTYPMEDPNPGAPPPN